MVEETDLAFHLLCCDVSVTFKTVPTDSTGVAHILEHTTLCGSEKYPVRDPFFNMLKRGLNTYMNAYTGTLLNGITLFGFLTICHSAHHTSYPFSTQNEKDYHNLLSVYLDATFFPKLDKFDFMQEGHRLELKKLMVFLPDHHHPSTSTHHLLCADPSSALKIKGGVYNKDERSNVCPLPFMWHFHSAIPNNVAP